MAQYKHLPIYKTTYELLQSVTREDFDSLRATVNSYFGMLRNANAYKERKRAAIELSKRGCWFDGRFTKLVRLGAPSCISA